MANPEPDQNLKLPERLAASLREYASPPVLVPPERDESTLLAAKRQLRQQLARARWQKSVVWAAAAAVAIAAFVWSVLYEKKPHGPSPTTAGMAPLSADLDGNG